MKRSLEPFERANAQENPFKVQQDLQNLMQDLVGIVRSEDEMQRALTGLDALKQRAAQVGVTGHREFNTGWHASQDSVEQLLVVSEMVTRSAIERKESRGGHFRQDYPDKEAAFATFNFVVKQGGDGQMLVLRAPIPPIPAELKQVIEENK